MRMCGKSTLKKNNKLSMNNGREMVRQKGLVCPFQANSLNIPFTQDRRTDERRRDSLVHFSNPCMPVLNRTLIIVLRAIT